jgi:hypothetical protein
MILLKVQPLACRRDEGKLAGNPDGLSRERAGKEQGDSRRRRRAGESDTPKVVSPSSEGAAPLTGPCRGRARAARNGARPYSNQLNALITRYNIKIMSNRSIERDPQAPAPARVHPVAMRSRESVLSRGGRARNRATSSPDRRLLLGGRCALPPSLDAGHRFAQGVEPCAG